MASFLACNYYFEKLYCAGSLSSVYYNLHAIEYVFRSKSVFHFAILLHVVILNFLIVSIEPARDQPASAGHPIALGPRAKTFVSREAAGNEQ